MYLNDYLETYHSCPICNCNLNVTFSHKGKKINKLDGYYQFNINLINSFVTNSMDSYDCKYYFVPDSYFFFIDFYKNSNLLSTVPIKVINTFFKKNIKDVWIYQNCPNLCCSMSSNFINFNFKSATINPINLSSYTVDLNQNLCQKYDLPYINCKLISSIERNFTYLVLTREDQTKIEYDYHHYLDYHQINKILTKLPCYLLLS